MKKTKPKIDEYAPVGSVVRPRKYLPDSQRTEPSGLKVSLADYKGFDTILRHGYRANTRIGQDRAAHRNNTSGLHEEAAPGGLFDGQAFDSPASGSAAHGAAGHALARTGARAGVSVEPERPKRRGNTGKRRSNRKNAPAARKS